MFAYCLEVDALLSCEDQLNGRFPENFGGFDMSILEGFIGLVIMICVDDFEMCSWDIFGVFLDGGELDIFKLEIFFEVSHDGSLDQ